MSLKSLLGLTLGVAALINVGCGESVRYRPQAPKPPASTRKDTAQPAPENESNNPIKQDPKPTPQHPPSSVQCDQAWDTFWKKHFVTATWLYRATELTINHRGQTDRLNYVVEISVEMSTPYSVSLKYVDASSIDDFRSNPDLTPVVFFQTADQYKKACMTTGAVVHPLDQAAKNLELEETRQETFISSDGQSYNATYIRLAERAPSGKKVGTREYWTDGLGGVLLKYVKSEFSEFYGAMENRLILVIDQQH